MTCMTITVTWRYKGANVSPHYFFYLKIVFLLLICIGPNKKNKNTSKTNVWGCKDRKNENLCLQESRIEASVVIPSVNLTPPSPLIRQVMPMYFT